MSELSTRIRKLVDDPTVSDVYGEWGILQPIQRKQIRELCDLCDTFENAADTFGYELDCVMHSVDKWLEGDELKQDKVNRAATMREKTLQIIEGLQSEVRRLEKALKNILPTFYQVASEDDAIKLGREYGRREATKEILADVRRRLPTDETFHSSDIQLGYAWAMTSTARILNEIEREKLQEANDESNCN